MKKDIMETADFDKLLKAKLKEPGGIHQKEMDEAKPFVWTAIQANMKKTYPIRWYHLAAAVVLLFISFGIVLRNVQKGHAEELDLLAQEVDELRKQYVSQGTALQSKDQELSSLTNELKNLEVQLTDLQIPQPQEQQERIVYRTDTIVLRQIEYVTQDPIPVLAAESSDKKQESDSSNTSNNNVKSNINYSIYPSVAREDRNQKSENIKIKFLQASGN